MILANRKVDYGLLLLFHLMHHPEGASARSLASSYRLSRPFVANILKELCQAGFVESQRGVRGGYRLAKPPKDITLDQLVAVLDGPFQLMGCAEGKPAPCAVGDACPLRNPLQAVHERIRATLAEVSLEDLRVTDQPMVALDH